jgi:hypothetical protein
MAKSKPQSQIYAVQQDAAITVLMCHRHKLSDFIYVYLNGNLHDFPKHKIYREN